MQKCLKMSIPANIFYIHANIISVEDQSKLAFKVD